MFFYLFSLCQGTKKFSAVSKSCIKNINFRCLLLLPCLLILMWASYHSSHKTSILRGRNVIIQALTDTPGRSSEDVLAVLTQPVCTWHYCCCLPWKCSSPKCLFSPVLALFPLQFIWCQHVSSRGFLACAILFHFAATVFSGLVTFQRHLPSLVYGSTFNKMHYLGL